MNRFIACTSIVVLAVSFASAQTPKKTTEPVAKDKATATSTTSFVDKLLKFVGISDTPSTLKGPGDEVVTGDLWLLELESKTSRSVTATGGYRSPIFVNGSKGILALHGTDVILISLDAREERKLYSINGITKLVAGSSEDFNEAVILLRGETEDRPRVCLLTISTGAIKPVPYDPSSSPDLQMVESLQGQTRTYGISVLYVESQSKRAFSGTVEWMDVFLKVGDAKPIDLGQCDGTNCGQPSLSEDKHLVVFVKSLN